MVKGVFSLILGGCLVLAGCTSGREHFTTEPGKGFGWKDMSENHRLIGELGSGAGDVSSPTIAPQPYLVTSGVLEGVERIPEQYLCIWIPPYQDPAGNLHEESVVHTVIQTGQWKIPSFTVGDVKA